MGNSCSCPRVARRLRRRLWWFCGDCIKPNPKTKENIITLSPTALETTATPSTEPPSMTAMTSGTDTVDGEFQTFCCRYRSLDKIFELEMHARINVV